LAAAGFRGNRAMMIKRSKRAAAKAIDVEVSTLSVGRIESRRTIPQYICTIKIYEGFTA